MKINYIHMKSKYINIPIILLLFSSLVFIAADFPEWLVPADAAETSNPVVCTKKITDEGEALFKAQCSACHGVTAKGDGVIASANLTSKMLLDQSDGAIYYKIVNGRGVMPGFKAIAENDVWKIIYYIRSLSGNSTDTHLKTGLVKLSLNDKQIDANFVEKIDGKENFAVDIKVGVYVKRYFGLLPLFDGALYTDSEGSVSLSFPDGIPGDEEGNVTIIAKIEDSGFNPVQMEQIVNWGTTEPLDDWKDTWENKRALWRTNDMAPLWVIFSFLGITLGVWIGIFYVLLLIRKIKKLGD